VTTVVQIGIETVLGKAKSPALSLFDLRKINSLDFRTDFRGGFENQGECDQ
jgi:hypothetical protein